MNTSEAQIQTILNFYKKYHMFETFAFYTTLICCPQMLHYKWKILPYKDMHFNFSGVYILSYTLEMCR